MNNHAESDHQLFMHAEDLSFLKICYSPVGYHLELPYVSL